jgi:membrane protease YdiL (CAAX protease family)
MIDSSLAAALLALILVAAGIATSPLERRAYRAGAPASRKLVAYAVTILLMWALTAAAVSLYGWAPLLVSPGASAAWLPAAALVAPFLFVLLAAFFILALQPFLQSLRGLRWRRAYAAAIRREFAGIPGFIPNDVAERGTWILLSLTAGLCEEILYRGFLIRFLHDGSLALPIWGALALSSLCFGLGHAYQGRKGVVTSTIAGLGFGLLFLLSGSLIPGIVLHALIDLQMVYVMRPIPDGAGAAAEPA